MAHNTEYWVDRKLDDEDRDWQYGSDTWVDDYVKSTGHPHRKVILDILRSLEFKSLLEIGCSAGPNLKLIYEEYPWAKLYGLEVNRDSVLKARSVLHAKVEVYLGDVRSFVGLPEVDVILADASLMYLQPGEAKLAVRNLSQKVKKSFVIVDRHAEEDMIIGNVWARNYRRLMEENGFWVMDMPVTEETWGSSKNWVKHGRFYLCIKQSESAVA